MWLTRTFSGALGWEEIDGSDDDWAAYLVGGVLFALYPFDELATEAGAGDRQAAWSGVTLACNVDLPGDVDTSFEAAVNAGATPISTPATREWGGRSGYIADPEENRWEIAWAPTARFDDRGSLVGFGS
ncbi:VOC family protein [Herbiconiux liangxiaofengii]|uniref:VOC family protein n=1 Tax=Herbiconiux liangxiaofengii TaxID=3342795 RepID=UPI0035BB3A71